LRISLTHVSCFKECDPSEEGTACWNVTTVIKYNTDEYDSDVVEASITEAIENGQTEGAYFSELNGFKSLPYRSMNVTSSIVTSDPMQTYKNEAVAGSNETGAIVGLGFAVVISALLACLMGFFAFRRRAENRKNRVHAFSYESNKEADKLFFADDLLLPPARCPIGNSFPSDEEEGRDEVTSVATHRASNKSGASRASSNSSMSGADKSIMSQIRLPKDLIRKDTGLKSVTSTKSTKTITSTNSIKRKAEKDVYSTKPTKKEAGNLQEQNQTTSEEESPSLLKSAFSGLTSLGSWKNDTPREEKRTAIVDEASKKMYYYNEDTQETTWVNPEGFVDDLSKKTKVLVYSEQEGNHAQASAGEWQVATDTFSGKVYYFNMRTLERTWTKPKGFSDGNEGSDDSDSEVSTVDLGSLKSRKMTSGDKYDVKK